MSVLAIRANRLWATQEGIVFLIAIALFLIFSILLPGFLSADNLLSLLRNVSTLGILGLGMAVVVIGRGIDLAIVATMAMSVAWVLVLAGDGLSLPIALAIGFCFASLIGLVSGVLIAYSEIPPLFATLAMTSIVYGFGQLALVHSDTNYLPSNADSLSYLGNGAILAVPLPVILWAVLTALAFAFLRYTRPGRFIYAIGDNPNAARIAGIAVRPASVALYMISSTFGFVAGLITAGLVGQMETRIIGSTMVYDVVLVVALGGISLSGGKGGVRNVFVGTLLIGTLLNGMTILDLSYTGQNIIKGIILLLAIVVDSFVNPRDEQTARQGDI